ncbi:MAG TPA: DNA gyrase inhibitor YacG [Steroidobacteraceae bacterium]
MAPPRVKCPTCGRQIEWSENSPFRPFCSERCRLIDLGAWLSEKRAIPGESADNSDSAGHLPTEYDPSSDDPRSNN